jgi:hypothetical protein
MGHLDVTVCESIAGAPAVARVHRLRDTLSPLAGGEGVRN